MRTSRRRPRYRPTKCNVTGKVRFPDHDLAVEVLHDAANRRRRWADAGTESRRQECRTYECDGCKGWHLTSQAA